MRIIPFRSDTLREVLDDPYRKSVPRIVGEAVAFGLHKREVPRQYFRSMLYRKHVSNPSGFMTHRQYWRLRALTERPELIPTLRDKVLFNKYFEHVEGVRLPRWLGHTDGHTYHAPDGSVTDLKERADLDSVLQSTLEMAAEHGMASLFAKPRTECGGRGVQKITAVNDGNAVWDALSSPGYVFQQTVPQHEAMSAIYPHSLNTLRIMTCHREDVPAEVSSVMVRFGRGGNHVDNSSAGGFFSGVDLDTGRITRFCTTMLGMGSETYTEHPDTGHPLVGYAVPYFQEALEMALVAANALAYPLVGWDLAIAPEGPILIEGNDSPDYHYDEVANGGYLTRPVLGPLIDELTNGEGL